MSAVDPTYSIVVPIKEEEVAQPKLVGRLWAELCSTTVPASGTTACHSDATPTQSTSVVDLGTTDISWDCGSNRARHGRSTPA